MPKRTLDEQIQFIKAVAEFKLDEAKQLLPEEEDREHPVNGAAFYWMIGKMYHAVQADDTTQLSLYIGAIQFLLDCLKELSVFRDDPAWGIQERIPYAAESYVMVTTVFAKLPPDHKDKAQLKTVLQNMLKKGAQPDVRVSLQKLTSADEIIASSNQLSAAEKAEFERIFAEKTMEDLKITSTVRFDRLAFLVPVYGAELFATVRAALNANPFVDTLQCDCSPPTYFSREQWNELLALSLAKPRLIKAEIEGVDTKGHETEAVLVKGIKGHPSLHYLHLRGMTEADVRRIVQALGNESKSQSLHFANTVFARTHEIVSFLLDKMHSLRAISFGGYQRAEDKDVSSLVSFLENSNQLLSLEISSASPLVNIMQKMLEFTREDVAFAERTGLGNFVTQPGAAQQFAVATVRDLPPICMDYLSAQNVRVGLERTIDYLRKILPKPLEHECKLQTLVDAESKQPFIAIPTPNPGLFHDVLRAYVVCIYEACITHHVPHQDNFLEAVKINGVSHRRVRFPKQLAAIIAVKQAELINNIDLRVKPLIRKSILDSLEQGRQIQLRQLSQYAVVREDKTATLEKLWETKLAVDHDLKQEIDELKRNLPVITVQDMRAYRKQYQGPPLQLFIENKFQTELKEMAVDPHNNSYLLRVRDCAYIVLGDTSSDHKAHPFRDKFAPLFKVYSAFREMKFEGHPPEFCQALAVDSVVTPENIIQFFKNQACVDAFVQLLRFLNQHQLISMNIFVLASRYMHMPAIGAFIQTIPPAALSLETLRNVYEHPEDLKLIASAYRKKQAMSPELLKEELKKISSDMRYARSIADPSAHVAWSAIRAAAAAAPAAAAAAAAAPAPTASAAPARPGT